MKRGKPIVCYTCGTEGHKSNECKKKWCRMCKSNSHTDKNCRKNQSNNTNNTNEMAKVVKNTSDFHTFQFRVDDCDFPGMCNSFLVDTGATSHIANDESMFIDFDPDFNPAEQFLELADGTK